MLALPNLGNDSRPSPRVRIAVVHATTLLLSATFEEFVRQMAKEYAMQIVKGGRSLSGEILESVWKQTFRELVHKAPGGKPDEQKVREKINALFAFINGDTNQDIYAYWIKNERGMGVNEINRLFNSIGIPNICCEICKQSTLSSLFELKEQGRTHGKFVSDLNAFFERRNGIAHSLGSAQSIAPEMVKNDVDMFRAFSGDLTLALEDRAPNSVNIAEIA